MQACIQEKGLQNFYPPNSPILDQIAQQAAPKVNQVIQRWRVQKEIANDIVKLALYDIVLYIDDSGSMQFEEEGTRIKDLRLILERVSFAATLFDADGISMRFMNTDLSGARDNSGRPLHDGVATEAQIEQIMTGVQFKGLTPMGTSLRKKVIDEIVLQKAAAGQLRKPVLVIAITDGQPAGEPQNAVFDTIRYAFDTLQQRFPQYGRGGIAFEFAQVGNDEMARKFLSKLDEDPQVGPMVDCTSSKFQILRAGDHLLTHSQTSRMNRKRCLVQTRLLILRPISGSSSSFLVLLIAATIPKTRRPTILYLAAMAAPEVSTVAHLSKVTDSSHPKVNTAPHRKASTRLKDKANMAPHLRVSTRPKVKVSTVRHLPVNTRRRVSMASSDLLKAGQVVTQVSSSMANHLRVAGTRHTRREIRMTMIAKVKKCRHAFLYFERHSGNFIT